MASNSDSTYGNFEIGWPQGEETWIIHDEMSRDTQFVECKRQLMLTLSTCNTVENLMQQTSSECVCDIRSADHPPNEVISLLQRIMANQNLLMEDNKFMKEQLAKQKAKINQLVLAMKTIDNSLVLHDLRGSGPSLEEQHGKQSQLEQIDRSTIEDSYTMCNTSNIKHCLFEPKTLSLKDSSDSNVKQLKSTTLVTLIFVSWSLQFLKSYITYYNDVKTPHVVNNALIPDITHFDWFRTLAVP